MTFGMEAYESLTPFVTITGLEVSPRNILAFSKWCTMQVNLHLDSLYGGVAHATSSININIELHPLGRC